MEDVLNKIWNLLGIPAVWGSILTVTTVVMGVVLKRLIDHALESQLEEIKALQTQDAFVRELYAENLKKYAGEQAQALRQAYLLLFEPHSSNVSAVGKSHEEQLDMAIQMIMQPLRKYAGGLDESTIKKINSVCNYLAEFKGQPPEELRKEKVSIYNETEMARQFVKVDKIAFRLGLIRRPLEERRLDGK
jgi:hypothetical protein